MNTQTDDLGNTGCDDCNVIQLTTGDRTAMCESCDRMMYVVAVNRLLPIHEQEPDEGVKLCPQ